MDDLSVFDVPTVFKLVKVILAVRWLSLMKSRKFQPRLGLLVGVKDVHNLDILALIRECWLYVIGFSRKLAFN